MFPLQPACAHTGLHTEGGDGVTETDLFNWIKVGALELGCEGAESCLFGAREVLFVTTGRVKVRQPHVSEGV